MCFKDQVQTRAEELADSLWGEDFYDLPEPTQMELFDQAQLDVLERHADEAEAAYEGLG